MAYYTIAHLLQGDLFGEKVGPLGISAEQLTPEVYDYIFCEEVRIDCMVSKIMIILSLSIHLFIYSSIHLFIYLSIHSSIHH